MRRRVCEALLILAFIATWYSQTPRPATELPSPCPEQVLAQHHALSEKTRQCEPVLDFFENCAGDGDWVIVRYTVTRQGAIRDVRLEQCSGPHSRPELVVEGMRGCASVPPLPEGVQALEIVELFWATDRARFTPGTLEAKLNELDDGRWIRCR